MVASVKFPQACKFRVSNMPRMRAVFLRLVNQRESW
jgi:hypothetical protein